MKPLPGLASLAWIAAMALSWAGGADAASLQVSPTSVVVQARENASGLSLSNTGSADLHAQVRVYRWTQVDGEDRLEPTQDIAISPPMLKLAGGAQQLVRVIRLGAPASTETSYRVIVDELPVDGATPSKPGLQFVLRYSVPVFLMPQGVDDIAPALHARLAGVDGSRALEIANNGRQHAQVADLAYVDGNGARHAVAAGLAGYVLPGQAKHWPLPAAIQLSPGGRFEARINGEPDAQPLPLDASAR
jgi:fimbrial chaperone protein